MFTGVLFVFLITRSISSELLATWYLFVATFGLVTMGEMGLSTVFSRHIVYIRSDFEAGKYSREQFQDFLARGERTYKFLAAILFVIAAVVGSSVLLHKRSMLSESHLLLFWFAYSLGGACSILSLYYAAIVTGMGEMWRTQKLSIFSVWINAAVLLLFLFFQDTLLIPVAGYTLSQMAMLIMYRGAAFRYSLLSFRAESQQDVVRIPINSVRNDAMKTVVGIAAYQGLTNGFLLILSRFYSNDIVASYGLSMQFCGIATSLSMVWASTAYYDMAANKGKGKDTETQIIFRESFYRSSAVCLVGVLGILLLGPTILDVLGSRTQLFRTLDLAVLLCVVWFDFNYGLFAQLLISQGELRVSYIAAVGAIAVCGLTFLLASLSCSLQQIFMARLAASSVFFGAPYLVLVGRMFRLSKTSIRRLFNETSEYLHPNIQ